jgi:hypothetical protein
MLCMAVLPLIPTRYMDGLLREYADSNQLRTCRSLEFLRDWTASRASGHESYVEGHQSIMDPEMHEAFLEIPCFQVQRQ